MDSTSNPELRRGAAKAAREGRPEYPVRRPLKRAPSHPGELMREILEDHVKMSIAEAARRMKISRPALHAVLNGTSAVTADMALRFTRLTGGTPIFTCRCRPLAICGSPSSGCATNSPKSSRRRDLFWPGG